MSELKLLTYPGDFRAFKCLIAARFNGVTVATDPDFKVGTTDKEAWFLKLSPLGKVPVLQTSEGPLLESNAIARHLARFRNDTELFGKSFFENAQVDSWIDWSSNELEIPVCMWIYPIFEFLPANPKSVNKAKQDVKKALKVLDAHLASRSFLVGRKVTLADIVLVSTLVYPMKMVFDAKFRNTIKHVTRWFMTCVAMPEFTDVVNEVNLCKTEMQLPKSKGKKAKKAKQPKAKQAKKAKKPKPVRIRHPLDMLPKSAFIMDTWKKTYSNSKRDYYKSMEYFWANFDYEGYSIWRVDYKFNAENKVDWLCSNKIGGYTQRLDDVRKWTFGVMAVLDTFEKSACYEVMGYWITRGDSMKHLLAAHEEGDTFTWVNMGKDLTEAQKQDVADLWCGEKLKGSGIVVNDSVVFK